MDHYIVEIHAVQKTLVQAKDEEQAENIVARLAFERERCDKSVVKVVKIKPSELEKAKDEAHYDVG